MESSLRNKLFLTESTALEDIKIQDVNGVPYFVIPMYSPYPGGAQPTLIIGKDYKEEYQNALEEHYQLTQALQDLLYERNKLYKALGSEEQTKSSASSGTKYANRTRRLAKDITRHFKCPNCTKSYGSEGSLNHHLNLKHSNIPE